ncbi:hypothetical protein GOODEAATRI_010190, partial [Goodea atripinnis]
AQNKFAKFLLSCMKCCFWCLEKCIKFLNRNAYIMFTIKKNRESVLQMRQENKRLYRQLADANAVLSKTKRVNALKHTTQTYQQRIDELNMEEERMKQERRGAAAYSGAWTCEKEEDAMAELEQLEGQVLKEENERNSNIARLRKVDERKSQAEKPEKKVRLSFGEWSYSTKNEFQLQSY